MTDQSTTTARPYAPVTVTLGKDGRIADVDFVQWALNEIADKAFKRQQVADTYAILLQKGARDSDWRAINMAIINRWSPAALKWIKERAWKQAQSAINTATRGDR